MKKILSTTLFMGLMSTSLMAIDLSTCKGCHGQDWEKAALGKSKVVKDMSEEEIASSLKGYKDGSYGGPMAGIMKGHVIKYSDSELDEISKMIFSQLER